MKNLILSTAFVASPMLYAKQEPTSHNNLEKQEVVQNLQNKTMQAEKVKAIERKKILAFNLYN